MDSNALNMEKQERQLAELKEEMSRLDSKFMAMMKEMGLHEDDLKNIQMDDVPQEVRAALEQAQAKARQDGERRASQYKAEESAPGGKVPGRRAGVLRL